MLLLYVYVMDNVYFCRLQQCCCGIVIRIVDKIRLFRQKSMRYFTNILRWISSQEHLYFLFGLLFIIPNCVFLFTEPLPVPVGLASIVMPLAFWMGVLLLARKPGVVVWCLLPKIILDGGQLVLLYLFGESVIAVDMFLNLTSSNASEASELFKGGKTKCVKTY